MDAYRCDNCGHNEYFLGPKVNAINADAIVKCANCGAYMIRTNTGYASIAISDKLINELESNPKEFNFKFMDIQKDDAE